MCRRCSREQPVRQNWLEADMLEEAAAPQADAVLETESGSPLRISLIIRKLLELFLFPCGLKISRSAGECTQSV